MKKNIPLHIFAIIALFFSSCNLEDKPSNSPVKHSKPVKTVILAEGFEIQSYETGLKKVYIFDLSNKGDTLVDFWLVDYANFQGDMPDGKMIAVPVTNFACRSTTHLAFFNFLEKTNLVNGVCYANYANNPLIKSRVESGEIKNLTTGEEIDLEILASLSPQVFTTYPYGNINQSRINSLGIISVPILEYLESTPLQRAEWIKLIGVLVGEEDKANQLFNEIVNSYKAITDKVNESIVSKDLPTIFTGSSNSGKWSAPSGKSLIAKFIHDAGGKYVFEDNKKEGNIELEYEAFFSKVIQTDYWGKVIYEQGDVSVESLLGGDKRLNDLSAVKNGNIFFCNATKTDYFGDAIMQPEVILQDLVNIFHPGMKSDTSVYFKLVEH